MCTGFKLLSEAALHEYRATLDWYGYPVDDFELTERFDPPPKADVARTWGFVVVARISAGAYSLGVSVGAPRLVS